MAIWDVVGNLAEWNDWGFTNSCYGSVIGDEIYFTMGGGATYNILGTQTTLVIDWESLLEHFRHLGPMSSFKGMLGGLLFGIGGDTSMVLGNSNSFSYMGDEFSVVRGRNTIECKYDSSDLATLGLGGLTPSVYNAPVYAVALGCLALFTGALVLQLKYKLGLGDGNSGSTTEKLAISLIPALETRWLWVVKALEFLGSIIIPLNASATSVTSSISDINAFGAQLQDIDAKLKYAKYQVDAVTAVIKYTTIEMGTCNPDEINTLRSRVNNAKNQLVEWAATLKQLTLQKTTLDAQQSAARLKLETSMEKMAEDLKAASLL